MGHGGTECCRESLLDKDALRYALMIRQPDFVTDELAERILAATSRRKPHAPLCVGLFRALERWLVCAKCSTSALTTTNP